MRAKCMKNLLLLVVFSLSSLMMYGNNEPRIYLEKDSINVGTIGSYVRKVCLEIPLTNTGVSPLTIYKIKTDCICTRTKFDRKPVSSGETRNITVEIDIERFFTGENTKSIMIYSNAVEPQKQVFFTFTIE